MTLTAGQRKCRFPGVANQGLHNPSPFQMCVRTCMLSHAQLSVTPWTVATRLLYPWDFLGKNTGVGSHFLLQRIFLTQGSNPCLLCLLHSQADSLPLHHLGSPVFQLYLILSHSSCTLTSLQSELLKKAQARPVLLLLGLFMSCCYRS